MLHALLRIALWSFGLGGVSFAIGFFGPMLLAPGANQGPMLGIFITGPLGTLAGLVIGVFREVAGRKATPLDVLRSTGLNPQHLLRGAAGIGGVIVLVAALRRFPHQVDRGAAAGIVVATALLSYAAVGRIPAWFRR